MVPQTEKVRNMVRDHVRDMRKDRNRVTARQVLDVLVEKDIMGIPKDSLGKYDRRVFAAFYRATRRCLERINYKRGRRTGNLVPSPSVLLKKGQFLRSCWDNSSRKK